MSASLGCGVVLSTLSALVALLTLSDAVRAEQPDMANRLTLERSITIALAANPDIRLADLAAASAMAGVRVADTAPNPTLTVSASNLNTQAGIGSGDLRSKTFDSAVRIEQLIERGDKRQLRTRNAAALTLASQLDAWEARRQTVVAVSQAFYDLLAAQERVDITNEGARLMAETLAAARRRRAAGDLAPADVTRIEVDGLRAENDAGAARSDMRRARIVLTQLLGDARPASDMTAAGSWPAMTAQSRPDIDTIVAARADVRAAQARLDAARAGARLATASLQRDVTVGLQYDHFPASATNNQGNGNSIGISFQIPLFWRNDFAGEIRAAAVAVDTAQAILDRTRAAARNELARLFEDATGSAQRLERYDTQLLPAARRSADAAEFAFRHGAIAVMDVLDVRRTYRLTLLEALAARADQAKAAAALRSAAVVTQEIQ
jgi:cobalt-zinc-cadmium efflux system outer membrane protein